MRFDESQLTDIAQMAERYVKLDADYPHVNRAHVKAIAQFMSNCTVFEVAYFCQQVASWVTSDRANRLLTIFTNQLNDTE